MNRIRWNTGRQETKAAGSNPLALHTETLHSLQDTELARVVGGTVRKTVSPVAVR